MKTLSEQIIHNLLSEGTLSARLAKLSNTHIKDVLPIIQGMSFMQYKRLLEATVDRNPSLTSGTSNGVEQDELSSVLSKLSNKNPAKTNLPLSGLDKSGDSKSAKKINPTPNASQANTKISKKDKVTFIDKDGTESSGEVQYINNQIADIKTSLGTTRGVDIAKVTPVITPNNKLSSSQAKRQGAETAASLVGTVKNAVGKAEQLAYNTESLDLELARIKELAGVAESSTSGSTSACSISSVPTIIGNINRKPSTTLQVKRRKERDNKKRRDQRKRDNKR